MSGVNVHESKEGYVDKKSIEKSDVFIVIISKNWVKEPLRIQELEYAKELGKPIAVAVLDDVNPEPYLKNANVIAIRTFNREQIDSDTPTAEALIEDFVAEVLSEVLKKKIEEWRTIAEEGCKNMILPPISIPQFPPRCKLTDKTCSPFNCPKLKQMKGES